jgi:hypothetical protein
MGQPGCIGGEAAEVFRTFLLGSAFCVGFGNGLLPGT